LAANKIRLILLDFYPIIVTSRAVFPENDRVFVEYKYGKNFMPITLNVIIHMSYKENVVRHTVRLRAPLCNRLDNNNGRV